MYILSMLLNALLHAYVPDPLLYRVPFLQIAVVIYTPNKFDINLKEN